MDITTDKEKELYVIDQGGGYTCLGFDVCLDRCVKLARWLQDKRIPMRIPRRSERGSPRLYEYYQRCLDRAREYCERFNERCPIMLTGQLIGLEGRRVEVVDSYGDTRRFQVGKSTGWLPVHLELKRRDSSGGLAVMGTPFKSIRTI
jgi:hypothetical protein